MVDFVEGLHDVPFKGSLVVVSNIHLQFAILIQIIIFALFNFVVQQIFYKAEENILCLESLGASHPALKQLLNLLSVGLLGSGGVLVDLLTHSLECAVLYLEVVLC